MSVHTSIRFSKDIKVIGLIFRIECEELCQEAVEVLKENEMHPMVTALYTHVVTNVMSVA